MQNTIKTFYAFPSEPKSLVETISFAIETINKKNIVKILPWTDLNPSGKIILSQILKAIDDSGIFLCDLSGLNPNVCFELGYAIAKNKRIWITIDSTNPQNYLTFKQFQILSSIGCVQHNNDNDIVKAFFKSEPYKDINESILNQFSGIIDNLKANTNTEDILFYKSTIF